MASVETIVQTGAKPVFVDIEPADVHDRRRQDSKPNHSDNQSHPAHPPVWPNGEERRHLRNRLRKQGLIVLEDAAQALGCDYNGRPAGQFGLRRRVQLLRDQEPRRRRRRGMIVTNDDGVAEACRSIRVHGMGRERYYYDHLGYTARMDEVQAAVLRVKLTGCPRGTTAGRDRRHLQRNARRLRRNPPSHLRRQQQHLAPVLDPPRPKRRPASFPQGAGGRLDDLLPGPDPLPRAVQEVCGFLASNRACGQRDIKPADPPPSLGRAGEVCSGQCPELHRPKSCC